MGSVLTANAEKVLAASKQWRRGLENCVFSQPLHVKQETGRIGVALTVVVSVCVNQKCKSAKLGTGSRSITRQIIR